jgi:regulator of ribonuclease activity A
MSPQALNRFLNDGLGTADLVDELTAGSHEVRACDLQLRQFGGHQRFGGPVRTIRCHEDNALLRETLAGGGEAAVLVVDGGGSLHTALVGDQIAGLAVEHGWAGLVIHGAVRDAVALAELPRGVKALGTNPRKSGKARTGTVDVPVGFGGVTFAPEDCVFCDEDRVLVVGPGTV